MTHTSYIKSSQQHYDYMMLALAPLIICATFIYSFRVLLVCATAFLTARIVDVGIAVLRKQEIDADDKSSTVAALTFCMMLPVSVPLYIVIVTVALTILVGKHVFGGKDVYPFNLAALAMCMAAVNWPDEVFRAVTPMTSVNFWSGAAESTLTGSSQIKLGGLPYISTFDLLLGNHAAAMGSAFVLIIISIGIFLLVTKHITWHVPVSFLATCISFSLLFPRIYGVTRLYSFKYEILCSAIVFYAVFMLNEPATTPKNPRAKIIFGILTGVFTMLFRYFGSYEIGGCFALLLVNATEGYWDRIFEKGTLNSADEDLSCTLEIGTEPTGKTKKKKTVQKTKPAAEKAVVHSEETPAGKKVYKKETSAEKRPKPNDSKAGKTSKSPENKKSAKTAVKSAEKTKEQIAKQPVKTKKKPSEKPAKEKSARKERDLSATTTLDIISRAEDDLDQVEFSTQTIDMEQALREFEEKYNKGGK